nr:hypothetical protein [Tanacetum cinerariifolium]
MWKFVERFLLSSLHLRVSWERCSYCEVLPEADHCQPPQYIVNHSIFNAHNDLLSSRNMLMEQMTQLTSMCAMFLACCDDDDDYNFATTPNEPVDSLSMGDEHLNTISAMKSDEFIKYSVENLIPNPSESEGENGCDMPACFTTFSNVLFDADYESDSSDDHDSHMEEIDLIFTLDDLMPPGIEEDDYDSERDILILEELLDNYSLSLPVIESYHFDIPSFSRPPTKPLDGNTGILNIKMMGDNSEQKVPIPGLTITRVSNQEKSPDLLSHRGLEIFQPSAKCRMMIHGKNIHILDVPLFYFYPLINSSIGGIGLSSVT